MSELLSKLNGGELTGLVAVLLGPVVVIISMIATQWRRVRIAELETALKHQMLERGMSAADIELVMKANHESTGGPAPTTGNEALDKAALAQQMVENGYDGEDIERVLKAYQCTAKPVEAESVVRQA